jgi:CubicO group peptidase (beta-lactamase class C family)
VADASGEIWSGGFGEADHSSGRAFSPETISNAGSVSKLFTATAVMKLVEAGKLDLDAPIATWLPELSPSPAFPMRDPLRYGIS